MAYGNSAIGGEVHETKVVPLEVCDLVKVTCVHLAAFPDSALTKLGREAVRRYYEWQIIGPHDGLNIGAFVGSELVGFCFGGIRRGALGGYLERNRAFLIRRVIMHPWLLANPLFRERAQFAVKRLFGRLVPKRTPAPQVVTVNAVNDVPAFGILSIAVNPTHHGSGAGQLLMQFSEDEARKRGFTKMHLTVHPSNERAVRFYEKMGWRRDYTNDVWTGSMSKLLSTPLTNTDPA